ncbi:MAG: ribosome-associated translation inhibitor RaiA [Beijerinckiaceae bacterium]|jgi:ribosomal subunit interface protein|nr:ribosome-associated translation inhibitor RaiA [Beijerinckiaceae bacterium]
MTLRVTGKNFDLGEAMRGHIIDRVEAAISKYYDGGVSGHIVVDHEGSGYSSECTLHLSSGMTLHSEGRALEPYASFDSAATRLEKRLRRYNRRLKDHHHSKNGAADGNSMFADYILEAPDQEADEAEEFNPVVVAEKTSALQTLPVSEAVLQLDLTGAPVVVFLHATSDRVNIVYRRADGNVGWIDPAASEKTA